MNRSCIALVPCILLALTTTQGTVCSAGDSSRAKKDDPLIKMVDEAIEISKRRYLTANVHTPWQILHGMLALRGEYQIRDDKTGRLINAAEWMSSGVYFHGEAWFQKTKQGAKAHPYTSDYIFEGHPNQFLAIMSSAGFPIDHKFKAGKDDVTVRDMIRHAKHETNAEEETTWTLWSLSHYLGAEASWFNTKDEPWSIEKLVDIENRKTLSRSACGGSHSLFALAYALKQYRKTHGRLRGVWLQADMRVKRYVAVSKAYQNKDGSFSSEYFERRGFSRDFEKRLSTSGHVLEFLMVALPDKRLDDRWVRDGVYAVCKILISNKQKPAEPGALYHALDGLILYKARMTGRLPVRAGLKPAKPQPQPAVAKPMLPRPKKSVAGKSVPKTSVPKTSVAKTQPRPKPAKSQPKFAKPQPKRVVAKPLQFPPEPATLPQVKSSKPKPMPLLIVPPKPRRKPVVAQKPRRRVAQIPRGPILPLPIPPKPAVDLKEVLPVLR